MRLCSGKACFDGEDHYFRFYDVGIIDARRSTRGRSGSRCACVLGKFSLRLDVEVAELSARELQTLAELRDRVFVWRLTLDGYFAFPLLDRRQVKTGNRIETRFDLLQHSAWSLL